MIDLIKVGDVLRVKKGWLHEANYFQQIKVGDLVVVFSVNKLGHITAEFLHPVFGITPWSHAWIESMDTFLELVTND